MRFLLTAMRRDGHVDITQALQNPQDGVMRLKTSLNTGLSGVTVYALVADSSATESYESLRAASCQAIEVETFSSTAAMNVEPLTLLV